MTRINLHRLLMAAVLSIPVLGCSPSDAPGDGGVAGVSAAMTTPDSSGALHALAATGCSSDEDAEKFLATYKVIAVEKYGGGLTSEAAAKGRIGQLLVLSKGKFELRGATISQPNYRVSCHPVPLEGEVPQERWSNFYGFDADRKVIEVLDVYDPHEHSSDPDFRFEVVEGKGGRELWEMYDGWLYRMKAASH